MKGKGRGEGVGGGGKGTTRPYLELYEIGRNLDRSTPSLAALRLRGWGRARDRLAGRGVPAVACMRL